MKTSELFRSLVDYHVTHNLEECIDRICEGRVVGENGKRLLEGKDSNVPYHGFLIVANGDTLSDRLLKDKIVHDDSVEFSDVRNRNDLYKKLGDLKDDDGSFIFDGKNSRIASVQEVNNDVPNLSKNYNIYDSIPCDFFVYNSKTNKDQRMGTKTRIAIKVPYAYSNLSSSTESFQIKRSSYTDLGMGKVTHFDRTGLVEEFFLKYDPLHKDNFISNKHPIVGVYRKYFKNDMGDLIKKEDRLVNKSLMY